MSALTANAVFLAVLLLPALYAAWSDLRDLRIPNAVVLLCILIYLGVGPLVLPLEEWLWRFVPALIVLVIGFLLSLTGQFGAGDAKFSTAMVLYVAHDDLPIYMVIYAVTALAGLIVLRVMQRALPGLGHASGWRSLSEPRSFPLGLPIAVATLFYLAVAIRTYLTL